MEKIKKIFANKEKRIENLVFFLVVLVITLIVINKILGKEEAEKNFENTVGIELASVSKEQQNNENSLEIRLENILNKINGVGDVSVMITYSESSSIIPIYNVNLSTSTTEETDTSGGKRITETETNQKDVVTDGSLDIVTEKVVNPKIEGAIITAKGASDANIKSNIISAVEAVTGLATHKIQVFEMQK